MGSASKCLQFLSKDTGISSGPAAAEGFMSSIALLGKIMACFIMAGKIMGGENMAELVQNRQFFSVTSASQTFFLISREFIRFSYL